MESYATLDPYLRNKIMRYLHCGVELPTYYPGCWTTHKYFEEDKLEAVDAAFANNNDDVEVVNLIVQAYNDGGYTRYETIAFALTKCLMKGGPIVKEAGYKAVAQICQTPEQLMLYAKYTRTMKSGNGKGWCKSVRTWYATKDPIELVNEVTRVKARHGRSHKTLIKKSHLKVQEGDNARDAIVKYALFGLKRAKQLMANKEGISEIFDYIQKVDDLRHCEDPAAAAAIASQNQFTLDHVPGHLLTSQDVWNAILPQMSLRDLLANIQRIHNMGFLTSDSTTTAIVVSLLNNNNIVKDSKITPIEVYITLCNYEKNSRPMKHEKAKVTVEKQKRRRVRQIFDTNTGMWEWTVPRKHPKELKHWGIDQPPNQSVVAALKKLIDLTWAITPPTGVRYMITMDMRNHMFKGRQFCRSALPPKKKNKKNKEITAEGAEPTAAPPPAAADAPTTGGGDADTVEKKSKKLLQAECFFNKYVTPGHAAIITALNILKREKSVRLAVFTEEGVKCVNIQRNFTSIEEAEFILRKENHGRVQLDAPIEWAIKNKEKVDVFINMIDRCSRYMELEVEARGGRGPGGRFGPPPPPEKKIPDHCPVRALERYRKQVNMPAAKLVVMSLASHRCGTTDGTHEGVLDVVGIDEHVPNVLDAFVKGQFK